MRRLLASLLLPLSLASFAARAEKIAYVDVQRAIHEVDEGRAASQRLRGELDAKRSDIDKRQKELETMKADYDRQQGVLTEEAKQAKMGEMQKKYQEAQLAARQMQDDLSKKESDAMRSIGERMLQVVKEVSDKDGFSFVLDKTALLYAPGSSDITNEVVRKYNERFPTAGNASKGTGKKGKKSAQVTPSEDE